MGHILSHPVQSKNLQRFGNEKWRVGVAEMQGYRTNMEDAHSVVLSLPSHPNLTYVGVFDGHNGSAAAEFMAREMSGRINALAEPTDPAALARCVEEADAEFCRDVQLRANGSTACMALIDSSTPSRRRLTVANVGDSRTLVLTPTGSVRFTTSDHKPEVAGEARRIHAAGGSVSFGRVDGDLAMSRSIGDWAYKNVSGLGQGEQKVIPTPDVSSIELQPDDVVLVCCDGLVEKLSNEQLGAFLATTLAEARARCNNAGGGGQVDPARIVAQLLDHCLATGSKDNFSAALLLQEDGSDYARADEYAVGPYTEWANDRSFAQAFFDDAAKHGYSREETMKLVAESNAAGANVSAAAAAAAAEAADSDGDTEADGDSDDESTGGRKPVILTT